MFLSITIKWLENIAGVNRINRKKKYKEERLERCGDLDLFK